ncbi:flagellar hook-associated protein FlgK [Aquibacillus rhizosphaerae]|uniref:Flagellar hook-associated protein 1 n=1 Tax=Aquibacillus rhizosphaerae TaxID=3051431 RepID=A0ABT7L0C8_9BACI|nr:flagellar hook-associated protein FlgK [Aquibacillus sp. LR5S19]MDL4839218.1 flagellar hook-associated protein FlgK [Aquibacillus sp. LR5S19]
MSSTFHGLEVAKRALSTQQAALYTTSHNMSNANTEGYSRQRVNFEQVSTLTGARNTERVNSQIGSGVEAGSVERIRDKFLDVQYRNENSKMGYYESRAEAMSQMESIMNEPSEDGLSKSMDQFWQSLQDLSVNPEDSGARSVVRQRGMAVAETFNYLSGSLEQVRGDLKGQIDVTTTEFNSIVDQINNLNKQIGDVEPHGHVPNDLYDERDRLIDSLSTIANISVKYDDSTGQPSDIAMGKATVTLNGSGDEKGITLVDGLQGTVNHMHVSYDDDNNADNLTFYNPAELSEGQDPATVDGAQPVAASAFGSSGELKALIEMNGYVVENAATGETTVDGYYNKMLGDLDLMAEKFVAEFNTIHNQGENLADDDSYDFFEIGADGRAAATMAVTQDIIDDKDKIAAAAADSGSGDGSNAVLLAEAMNNLDVGLGNKTSVKSFYQSAIGDMGVVSQEAARMANNSSILRQQVEENRSSVSAVSLDEEMTNMIKFQHAYNAAARNMTAIDEMLDRVINNMGLVGR